jgi:hypothetical protein
MDAIELLDSLDSAELRDRLRRLEEERSALIALIRASRVRERARGQDRSRRQPIRAREGER